MTARRAGDGTSTFHTPDPQEPLLGHAEGIQASQLRKLRRGRIRPEVRIDLHGLRADEARHLLTTEIAEAAEDGARCVIVIHGKGLRSSGKPVLRASLSRWLGSAELAGSVLAFAPAQPEDGGRGATYVLLRRRRA